MRLKQKLADVTGAVGKLFGRKQEKDPAVAKLDAVKVSFCGPDVTGWQARYASMWRSSGHA